MRFHMLQNVQMALDFLRFKKIKLVNIRAEDIVDSAFTFQAGHPPPPTINFASVFIENFSCRQSKAHAGPHLDDHSPFPGEFGPKRFYHHPDYKCSVTQCSQSKQQISKQNSFFFTHCLFRNVLSLVEAAGKFFLSPHAAQFNDTHASRKWSHAAMFGPVLFIRAVCANWQRMLIWPSRKNSKFMMVRHSARYHRVDGSIQLCSLVYPSYQCPINSSSIVVKLILKLATFSCAPAHGTCDLFARDSRAWKIKVGAWFAHICEAWIFMCYFRAHTGRNCFYTLRKKLLKVFNENRVASLSGGNSFCLLSRVPVELAPMSMQPPSWRW